MDDLLEYLELGGELRISLQHGKPIVSVDYKQGDQHYVCGCYFENQDQLCAYLAKDGDFVLACLNGIKRLKAGNC